MTKLDVDHLRSWIGKQETLPDQVTRFPIAALSATLDRDDPAPRANDALPPLWHWLYFLPTARQSILGPDGHPARGGFLPPVPLPRRMWAGGRFTFYQPLRVDEAITRTSTVQDVTIKHGRNGALCFVLVKHEISGNNGPHWLKSTTSSTVTCRDQTSLPPPHDQCARTICGSETSSPPSRCCFVTRHLRSTATAFTLTDGT
jgi:hydroxyacyl-ACP dehydratase HTD2-like protein with hotdog domain